MHIIFQGYQGLYSQEVEYMQALCRGNQGSVNVTSKYVSDHVYATFSSPNENAGSDLVIQDLLTNICLYKMTLKHPDVSVVPLESQKSIYCH